MSKKHFALIVAAAGVLSLVVGAAAGRAFRPERATAQEGVLAVRQMAVVDSDGNLRGLVSADGEEPISSIYFYDTNGTPRVGAVLNESNESMLIMNDSAGEMRLAAGVTNEGGPGILLMDAKGKHVWEAPKPAGKK